MSVDRALIVCHVDETKAFWPLKGVRLCLLVASLAFVSCVVPVDVPEPDPGDSGSDAGTSVDAGIPLDAGQGTDAGLDAGIDAGVTPVPCSVPDNLGLFLARSTRQFVFPGCATASVSSDPGVSVVSRSNASGSATVFVTPSRPGAWVLTINANGSTQTRELLTDEQFSFDAGFVVRYPDRVDGLSGPTGWSRTVTRSGRLLVASALDRVDVYGPDAGREQTIAASAWPLVWAGDSLWTVRPGSPLVERWVDSPTGLRSTGTLDVSGNTLCFFCRVTEDKATSMIGTDLVEFTWDGGAFSRQVLTSGLQLPNFDPIDDLLIPEPPDKVWSANGCSYEPGCTTTVCDAIASCPPPAGSRIVMATNQHALVFDGFNGAIQLWALPLSGRTMLHARSGYWRETSPSNDSPTLVRNGNFLMEPVIHRNRIVYRSFAVTDASLTVTKHWVVLLESPRELRFIPR